MPETNDSRSSDKPITASDQDDFQRTDFSNGISEILISRKSEDSIVIGLYGKWGEGKSSVLNIIKGELDHHYDTIVYFSFNPWRFPNENQLIINFFSQLADVLDKKLDGKVKKIGDKIKKYITPLLPSLTLGSGIVGFDIGKSISGLVDALGSDIESQKEKIETFLKESGKRVVVIIDDIDRLESEQIQSIFRLVKLTADFKYTAYLLAFDDEMVARALGSIYENGEIQAGRNFLEKIVQVPIKIPKAQASDLERFLLQRIEEVIIENQISLTEEEQIRFSKAVNSSILDRLETPRLAVRYANSLRFSIPLLKGEVNTVDLLLIEAIKVFYPNLYNYIQKNRNIFTGYTVNDDTELTPEFKKENINRFKEAINEGADSEPINYRSYAISLLSSLFPKVREQFSTFIWFYNDTAETLETIEASKSIASDNYFDRYFMYTILKGDISDEYFDDFIFKANNKNEFADEIISRIGIAKFLAKTSAKISEVSLDQLNKVWLCIWHIGKLITAGTRTFFSYKANSQIASGILIQLLFKIDNNEDRLELIYSAFEHAMAFEFSWDFHQCLLQQERMDNNVGIWSINTNPKLLEAENWDNYKIDSIRHLKQGILNESGEVPIFKTYPLYAGNILFHFWPDILNDPAGVKEYLMPFLIKNPEEIDDLLKISSRIFSLNNGPITFADLSRERAEKILNILGEDFYKAVRVRFGDSEVKEVTEDDTTIGSATQRLKQIIYVFEKGIKSESQDQ